MENTGEYSLMESTSSTSTPSKGSKTSENFLQISVRSQEGKRLNVKIRPTTNLYRVFNIFAEREGVNRSHFRFRFDGEPIGKDDTPASLGMKCGDSIDAFLQQDGGQGLSKP